MAFNAADYAPYMPQTDFSPRLCDVLNYGYDLGLANYPIFDESYRETLNQKIVNHFYTREISAPTPGMFVFWLNRQLDEHMPQINKVYEMLAERDPLTTARRTYQASGTSSETGDSTNSSEGTNSASGTQTSGSQSYASNAPQVSMVGKDEVDYYDTGNKSGTESTTSESSSNTSEGTGHSETSGTTSSQSTDEQSNGAISDLVAAWYDGYNNGDLLVFEALEPCFMHVFGFNGYW